MHIHDIIQFKQIPFIFEYVNMLSGKQAKSKTTVEKNLRKLLVSSRRQDWNEWKWSLQPHKMNA